ncbi:MAG TPA: universal stress protein [bacterium]|nr:universal stress protein [bacterium]
MLKRILLAYDGSPYSEAAKTYALELAQAHGSMLNALFVIDQGILAGPRVAVPGPTFVPIEVVSYEDYQSAQDEMKDKGRRYLERLGQEAAAAGVGFQELLRVGYPDQVILREGRSYDLIVLGRKGNSDIKEETLGYTGEMLASNSAVPLLLAPKEHSSIDRCLLAYDGSQQAVRAMRSLRQVLDGTRWPVTVVTVRERGRTSEATANEAVEYFSAHGVQVDTLIKEGDPSRVILEGIQESGADILAMGAFGHRGLRELFLGTTTAKILSQSPVAVLLSH